MVVNSKLRELPLMLQPLQRSQWPQVTPMAAWRTQMEVLENTVCTTPLKQGNSDAKKRRARKNHAR